MLRLFRCIIVMLIVEMLLFIRCTWSKILAINLISTLRWSKLILSLFSLWCIFSARWCRIVDLRLVELLMSILLKLSLMLYWIWRIVLKTLISFFIEKFIWWSIELLIVNWNSWTWLVSSITISFNFSLGWRAWITHRDVCCSNHRTAIDWWSCSHLCVWIIWLT